LDDTEHSVPIVDCFKEVIVKNMSDAQASSKPMRTTEKFYDVPNVIRNVCRHR